jgi:hypothetical protein
MFLLALEVETNSFCMLTAMETIHWRLATTARLDRSSMTTGVASGAPASRVISVAVVEVGLLPPSDGLAQDGSTRRHNDDGLLNC